MGFYEILAAGILLVGFVLLVFVWPPRREGVKRWTSWKDRLAFLLLFAVGLLMILGGGMLGQVRWYDSKSSSGGSWSSFAPDVPVEDLKIPRDEWCEGAHLQDRVLEQDSRVYVPEHRLTIAFVFVLLLLLAHLLERKRLDPLGALLLAGICGLILWSATAAPVADLHIRISDNVSIPLFDSLLEGQMQELLDEPTWAAFVEWRGEGLTRDEALAAMTAPAAPFDVPGLRKGDPDVRWHSEHRLRPDRRRLHRTYDLLAFLSWKLEAKRLQDIIAYTKSVPDPQATADREADWQEFLTHENLPPPLLRLLEARALEEDE